MSDHLKMEPKKSDDEGLDPSPSPDAEVIEAISHTLEALHTVPEIQLHLRDLGPLFSKRPLILGEDEKAYDSLLAKVTVAFKPRDVIEELYVDDFVDAAWRAKRFRRHQDSQHMSAGRQVLTDLLQTATHPETGRPIDAKQAPLDRRVLFPGRRRGRG
jgi:hypothetical protein